MKTHENYLHLKEQYIHYNEKAKLIKKDWISYLKAIKAILDRKEILGMNAAFDVLKDSSYEEYKAKITMEEIEKRFKEYLIDKKSEKNT